MTVKDIFELRKQGRIEEAYDAIRPMYAVHKGKYTSICMFWTASDIFKLRLEQGRIDEATKIFHALKHVLPYVNDSEGSAMAFMQSAARRLANIPRQSDVKVLSHDSASNLHADTNAFDSHKGVRDVENKGISALVDEPEVEAPKGQGREDCSSDNSLSGLDDFSGRLVVGLDEGIVDRPYGKISAPQSKVLDCIKACEGSSIAKITAATGIPAKSVERHISALVAKGLVEYRGGNKSGGYFMVQDM